MGGTWLSRVGALAVTIGIGFFLKYAFDNGWIQPAGRIALGVVVGLALLLTGERLQRAANPSAQAPRYDVARIVAYLGNDRLPTATLGPVERVSAPPRRSASAWLNSQPLLMWATMGVAVLALSALLWRMARGVRYTEDS